MKRKSGCTSRCGEANAFRQPPSLRASMAEIRCVHPSACAKPRRCGGDHLAATLISCQGGSSQEDTPPPDSNQSVLVHVVSIRMVMDGVSTTFCSKYITKIIGTPLQTPGTHLRSLHPIEFIEIHGPPSLHMSSWNGIASGAQGDVHSVAVHERAAFLDCYLERSKVIRLVANCEQTSTSPAPHWGPQDLCRRTRTEGRKDGAHL